MTSISVTQALSIFNDFSGIPQGVLEAACQRGTRVHSACSAYAANIFVLNVPREWRGYFESFKKWFQVNVKEVFFVEQFIRDKDLGFHGTPDLGVALVDGFDFENVIVDIKTPAIERASWKAQTAAYQHLANKKYGPNFFEGHMALQLDIDGKMAKGISYKNQIRDFTAFMSALNCYRYFKGG